MFNSYSISIIKKSEKGVTLVELMVSMTLGLGLIGGLMSMYLGSRTGDITRIELSNMDANAAEAFKSLRKTIQHAGYASVTVKALDKSFYTQSDEDEKALSLRNPLCRDGKTLIVSGLGSNSGLLNPPDELDGYTKDHTDGDVITVIYRPDSPFKGFMFSDCATSQGVNALAYPENYPYGTTSSTKEEDNLRLEACSADTTATVNKGMHDPKESKVYSAFFLRQSNGMPKQLVCYGSRSRDAEPYVIADNIDNIQFRYGVKDGVSTSYKSADEINDDVEREQLWRSITSVQVAILVGSDNENALKNPTSRNYDLLGETITKSANDKRMYKAYSTTVYLHNVGLK